LDTGNWVFGGFTPLKWESRRNNGKRGTGNNCFKCDDSWKSFLFTLRNPHEVRPRKFPLKPESKAFAIFCDAESGPKFSDIGFQVDDGYLHGFGNMYANDTEVGGSPGESRFFTGSRVFKAKEIEVFEIRD
jgi:hypothetical protein